MSVFHMIVSSWRRVLAAFDESDRQMLLRSVCDAYGMEANAVAQYTQHADRMHYPWFRAELLRIAAEVQAHLPWLHEQILALGGDIPSFSPTPVLKGNSWECLRRDVETAHRDCVHLLEWIRRVEREAPVLAVGLQRIRKDKLRHREELRDMFMKSDPYTPAATGLRHAPEERLKKAWLERQKNKWLDHEKDAWEVEGKQTPWAEWSGEQEFKWATELPHYNREWLQRQAA